MHIITQGKMDKSNFINNQRSIHVSKTGVGGDRQGGKKEGQVLNE